MKHGITAKQYLKRFPDAKLISRKFRKHLSKKLSGSNNPFYGKRHPKKIQDRITAKVKMHHEAGHYNEVYKSSVAAMLAARTPEWRRRMSERMSGQNNPACDPETKKKLRGSNHWNWQGGKSYLKLGLFIYGYSFKKARKECLRRDGYRCRVVGCTEKHMYLGGEPGNVEVHHLLPRSLGGSNSLSNLVTLCVKHHPRSPFGTVGIRLPRLRRVGILRFPRIPEIERFPRTEEAA